MAAKPVVAILEAAGGAFDPVNVFFLAAEQIEGFLAVFGVARLGIVFDLHDQSWHFHERRGHMRRHFGGSEGAHFHQLQITQFLILMNALHFGKCIEKRCHGHHHQADHAFGVGKQFGAFLDGAILRIAAHAIAPFPIANAGKAAIGRAAVAVVANVASQYVVARIGEVFVLDDEIDFSTPSSPAQGMPEWPG